MTERFDENTAIKGETAVRTFRRITVSFAYDENCPYGKVEETMNTARLMITPLRQEDRESLLRIVKDPLVRAFYLAPEVRTQEEEDALFARYLRLAQQKNRMAYGVRLKERLIGVVHDMGVAESSLELGWAFMPAMWNQGYATEAVRAVMGEAFRRGFLEISAGAFEENGVHAQRIQPGHLILHERN